jgi:fructokinase
MMILCVGEAVIDLFQTPVKGLGEAFLPLPGGCAYNASIAIGRLGIPVAFLGRLSNSFFGEIQLKRLKENNVKDDLIIHCEQNTILAFIKTEEGKEPQYAFYEDGTCDRFLSTEELPALPPDTTCIVFGSISMTMEPIASTIETLILKEASRKVIAFDPNIRPFMIKDRDAYIKRFEKLAGASTIVKISLEDFEFIQPNPDLDEALEKLTAMGSKLAILTLGPDGAIAMLHSDNGNVIKTSVNGINVPNLVDTVGAGDTFIGAFLVWLENKNKMSHNAIDNLTKTELNEALAFANKAAAFVCTRHGAEPPTFDEVNRRN